MLACKEGHSGVIRLLLEKGAQADLQDNRGRSALMYSSKRNKLEVAKLLLENGAQVDIQDYGGWCALMIVSLMRFLNCC